MENITFEQLPQAVSILMDKVDRLADMVDTLLLKARQQEDNSKLLNVYELASLLDKAPSTIYAMTSDKRIPFHKRGNKLYFFESEILQWITQGGNTGGEKEAEFNARLEALRSGKKRKPRAIM